MEENMEKTDKMQDGVAELKKIAKEQPPRRKSLLTPKERSVVFGVCRERIGFRGRKGVCKKQTDEKLSEII